MRYVTFLFVLFSWSFAFPQLYTFRNFSHKDGLTISTVLSAIKTDDGSILLGSDGAGIIKYDGYSFQDAIPTPYDKDHHVTSIFEDGNKLYFTSQFKGLFLLENGKLEHLTADITSYGDYMYVSKIDSTVFVAMNRGFFIYDGKKLKNILKIVNKHYNLKVNSFIPLNDGAILLTNHGNFHVSKKNWRVIPLNNWLHVKEEAAQDISFAYMKSGALFLTDNKLESCVKIILNQEGKIFKKSLQENKSILNPDETITAISYNSKTDRSAFITTKNALFIHNGKQFMRVMRNYDNEQMLFGQTVMIDDQGEVWITSYLKGLYKVSIEPFTRIDLNPVFKSPNILTINKTSTKDIVISTLDKKTYFGSLFHPHSNFQPYSFKTLSTIEYKGKLLLGTDEGLKSYDLKTKDISNISVSGLNQEILTFLYEDNDILYVGIAKKGLHKFSIKENYHEIPITGTEKLPGFVYTAQLSHNRQTIYFGTNDGVYEFNKKSNSIKSVNTEKSLGSYVGVSTKDVYGNNWFTFDRGILGIMKDGDLVYLTDPKLFPSKLFYTLNSDNFGNLIIGTNKGINILTLNEYGKVLKQRSFDGNSGFKGYETNMRSQFQKGNTIYVGTIEGVFLINTTVLHRLPPPSKPVIISKKVNSVAATNNTVQLEFRVNNPKLHTIKYTYRIPGYKDEWSSLSSNRELLLTDLPNGTYTIEVKASYDGSVFSESNRFTFTIELPFWKTKWFVFLILFGIIILNIVLLTRKRPIKRDPFFNTKDTGVVINFTPQIILFGAISDTAVHILAPLIDPAVNSVLGLSLGIGFVLLGLYFMAISAKNNNQTWQYKNLLIAGFLFVLLHNLIDMYLSNLEPFFIIAVILINSLATFVFEKLRTITIYSFFFLLVNFVIMVDLDVSIYNKTLFLIVIIFSTFLSIFTSYLRYDSLEKLLFVSGIVNKGNVPTIAFNRDGIITYISENIYEIIQTPYDQLIGQHISFLNTFVPEEGNFRKVDLTSDFQDGKKYLVPMVTKERDIKWMEWSCKFFTENIKVIMGQNVTDRLELESTYEMLVQTAEDMIYQCDVNGYFRFLNHRCYEKWGYSEEELMTRNSLSLIPEDHVKEVQAFYRRHFQEKLESSYFEFPIQTKSGFIIWVGQHVTTIFKPGDKKHVTGFLALARDITYTRKQQEIIRMQRDDITSSINYAKKIQFNLLPPQEKMERSFEQSFVFYKPKDIVSGDFYWMEVVDDITIIALADCTGHGVPGSFMTLLGINLLNNIVLEKKVTDPGTILNELDRKLTVVLPQGNASGTISDGMEMTICVIDHRTSELSYSCAGSRFLVYENDSFTMYKGDVKHIGDKSVSEFRGFITHYTRLTDDGIVYLFTDGFQDQFGGVKNKKYSFRRMLELFESNIRLPLNDQLIMIEDEFDKWKSMYAQTDDVSIIAFTGLKDRPEDIDDDFDV